MGISARITAVLALAIFSVLRGIGWMPAAAQDRLRTRMVEERIRTKHITVQGMLEQVSVQALGIALSTAAAPGVVAAAQRQDRELAQAELVPVYETLRERFGV